MAIFTQVGARNCSLHFSLLSSAVILWMDLELLTHFFVFQHSIKSSRPCFYTLLLLVLPEKLSRGWLLLRLFIYPHAREGSVLPCVCEYSLSHGMGILPVFSNPSPVLSTSLWHFVSSEGNNKVSNLMLNHFPANKRAPIKNSILRGNFTESLTPPCTCGRRGMDQLENKFRLTEEHQLIHFKFQHLDLLFQIWKW